ncbi:DotD/TraH family lipoprotein [uncultured Rhodoblastus sp.]|uniref:DotD/TraH family lipoprotein n=1 Tax=uncultured Rhodoblastus sp. TaxID=543037 RepID=UPI0025FE180C|nr:DotD/TraH family lipoprotein [uncultured Rhodoblastus sp.]
MRQRVSTPVLVALAALSLAGCASVTPIPTTVATPGMPNAERELQESMSDVGREMARIGKMGPEVAASDRPTVVPGELDRQVSFQWNGSLDDAIRELAKLVGYAVEIKGASPFTPRVQVSIDPAPRRVYDLFRMLGEQAGSQAGVRLDSQHHLVEVVYLG